MAILRQLILKPHFGNPCIQPPHQAERHQLHRSQLVALFLCFFFIPCAFGSLQTPTLCLIFSRSP